MNRDIETPESLAIRKVADAIAATGKSTGTDAAGGKIDSLTEAVMGITAGLFRIAEAIDRLAEAVEDHS